MELSKRIPLFEASNKFSSKFYVGGNLLTPDRIEINDNGVTYKKRNSHLIGVDEIFMPYNKISGIEINRGLINSDIIIHSTGSQKITANNFLISDAKEIKKQIESKI